MGKISPERRNNILDKEIVSTFVPQKDEKEELSI